MKSAAIMRIFVVVSNNMTKIFTINYYACMKRTYITTMIVLILGIYLRFRLLGKNGLVKKNQFCL